MLKRSPAFGLVSRAAVVAGILFSLVVVSPAQDDAAPPPKKPGVQITFLPPPMQGSLSLGIYDKKGRLVRTLVREGSEKDFVVGLNGLIIQWDGKDDAGKQAPPGTYGVRGYSVGTLEVEGIDYLCNDWMTDDDSPRIRRMLGGRFDGFAGVTLQVELLDGSLGMLNFLPNADKPPAFEKIKRSTPEEIAKLQAEMREDGIPPNLDNLFGVGGISFAFGDGKLWREASPKKWEVVTYPDLHRVVSACAGDESSVWVIDEADQKTEVKEYSFTGEILRRLSVEPGDPVPTSLSVKGGELFLFEEDNKQQRARILWRETTKKEDEQDVSIWKTVASKTIHFSDTYDQVKNLLLRPDGKPFVPDKEFVVHLINNPLLKDEPTTAKVTIGFNDKGSFLQTTDGLPLRRITETPHLLWTVIGKEGSGKLLTVFQSDGAFVEEFRVKKLANMMAFDAGDYELK